MITHHELRNCIGCKLLDEIDGVAECMNLIYWHGGTPENLYCYEAKEMNLTPEFMAAMKEHLRLVDTLGEDHPDTMRAVMLAMDLAPDEIKDEVEAMARELDLIPESDGYLADGTPMIRLEDLAEKLGVSLEDAESRLQAFMADRTAMGLSNNGIVTDPALIHRKQ